MRAPATGLLARFREIAGERQLAKNTVETYTFWLRKFHACTGRKQAAQWTGSDVSAFLHWMADARPAYSPVSRKQALCAIVFAFKWVLHVDPGLLDLPEMPRARKLIKIIPNREEIARIIGGIRGQRKLLVALLYGSGTRVEETCRLRVKDIDLAALTIRIHQGKGDKDGLVQLPLALVPWMQRQLNWRAALHAQDLAEGAGFVELPGRHGMKDKGAARDLGWQFLFASAVRRGQQRWHLTPEAVQQAVKTAKEAAGITKRVTPHTLRSAYATHALRISGNDLEIVQRNLRHTDVRTTMGYIAADGATGTSPLDAEPSPAPRLYTLRPRAALST